MSRAALCIAFALLLGLAGCERSGPDRPAASPEPTASTSTPATEQRSGNLAYQRAADADPNAFAVREIELTPQQSHIAVLVRFTRPLNPLEDYNQSIRVVDAENGSKIETAYLQEDNQALVLNYASPNRQLRLEVDAGLTAADGATLGSGFSHTFYSGELPPFVALASSGNVLPRGLHPGLPIVAVNAAEVDAEFYRVRNDKLPQFILQHAEIRNRGSWELQQLVSLIEPVYRGRFRIERRGSELTSSYLPISGIDELSQSGVYFVRLEIPGRFDYDQPTGHFMVSDLAVHLRRYPDSRLAIVHSLASANPMGGVEIALHGDSGALMATATTGADGLAELPRSDEARTLIARKGNDLAIINLNQPGLDISAFAVDGPALNPLEIFLWSGRDLYRPGETVRVLGLLRDSDGRLVPSQPLLVRLRQPDDSLYAERAVTPDELGAFVFERLIPDDAATGRWRLDVHLSPGGADTPRSYTLKIEEFLPERMKLELATGSTAQLADQPITLTAIGAYLYGAPASAHRISARLIARLPEQLLESLPGYSFGNPSAIPELPVEPVLDTELDNDGKLSATLTALTEQQLATPIEAVILGSLYETGGRTVTRRTQTQLWPAEKLIGIKPRFADREAAQSAMAGFDLLRVSRDGAPSAAKVVARLYSERQEWRWLRDSSLGWVADSRRTRVLIGERELSLADSGPTAVEFAVEWGPYALEVTDLETELVTRLEFNAGWATTAAGVDAPPDRIKIALDKPTYAPGDTIRATLASPHAGNGYVLLETNKLKHKLPISIGSGPLTVELPLAADAATHDLYLTAIVVRPGDARAKRTPKRALGIAHVKLDRGNRDLALAIEAAAEARPQAPLQITLKAPQLAGVNARVSVHAVDRGILNITNFALPDAAAVFFGQRRYGIDAIDSYGRIIEFVDGALARLKFGGDAALAGAPQARKPGARVLTVDLYSGPVSFDAQGTATVSLDLPDFNGALRIAALAYGPEQFAKAEAETVVRAPIVAEVGTARVLAPGDQSTISLDVRNLSGESREVKVTVASEGPIGIGAQPPPMTLANDELRTVNIPLQATATYGIGRLLLNIDAGDYRADRRFEIAVRPAAPGVHRRTVERVISAPRDLTVARNLYDDLVRGSANARVLVTTDPPIRLAEALNGLVSYPFGCAEQTMSRLVPYTLFSAEERAALGATERDDNPALIVSYGLDRLASMQLADGNFALWPGGYDAQPTLLPQIVELLLDAKERGLPVAEAVLTRATDRLAAQLNEGGAYYWSESHSNHLRFAQAAHAAQVLARVQRAPLGLVRSLYERDQAQSLTALPHLRFAHALRAAGDEAQARKAFETGMAHSARRPLDLWDYGSDLRDELLTLTLALRFDQTAVDNARLQKVTVDLANQPWLSTQEYKAILHLGQALDVVSRDGDAVLKVETGIDGSFQTHEGMRRFGRSLDDDALRASYAIRLLEVPGPVYVSTDVAGYPLRVEPTATQDLRVERRFFTLAGKPADLSRLKQGDVLIVHLRIDSSAPVQQAAVVDLLAGGLEAENLNLLDSTALEGISIDGVALSERMAGTTVHFHEYRDDRYAAALSLYVGQSAHLYYLARVVTPGTYALPPTTVEDMYNPEWRAVGTSGEVRVE